MAVISDVITDMEAEGYRGVNEWKIRHAIRGGHVSKPPLDGSRRFNFGPEHVAELRAYFDRKGARNAPADA